MRITISNFSGGIRPTIDAIKNPDGNYPLLSNGRTLGNVVSTIPKARRDELPTAGKLQASYALDHFLVVIISGQGWFKDTTRMDQGYTKIEFMQLDPQVDEIHMQPVPSSTLNFKRKLVGTAVNDLEFNTEPIATSLRGALVMDGINQDWIIYPTTAGLSARVTQGFSQWHLTQYTGDDKLFYDTQEYVPIGKYPIWNGQRVYKMAKDASGAYTRILGSVSGRPLDWVVEIKSNGDKPSAPDRTAHAVAYEPVAALYTAPSQDTSFVACTSTRTFGVFGDPNILLFGEKFLRTVPLFQAGAVSHHGAVDVNGELTVIGHSMILGLNATTQEAAQALSPRITRNRAFSAPVAFALTFTPYAAATRFGDYAFYAMNTILGFAVIVYDMNQQVFVSIDQWEGVGAIKQFTTTFFEGSERLWCRTVDNELFECFAGVGTETARLYLGDVSSNDAFVEHIVDYFACNFTNVVEDTTVTLDVYRDRLNCGQLIRTISGATPFLAETIIPFDENRTKTVNGFIAGTNDKRSSFASGVLIQWNGAARLTHLGVEVSKLDRKYVGTAENPANVKVAFLSDTKPIPELTNIVDNINAFAPALVVGGGDLIPENGSAGDYDVINAYLSRLSAPILSSPGDKDTATDLGVVFYNYYGGGLETKVKSLGKLLDVFYVNSGYGSSQGIDDVPDNATGGNDVNSVQAAWLKAALAESTAKFKLVVVHHPPYTDDVAYATGYSRLRWPYRAWGATMVVSGHATSYQRMWIDDIPYVVAGTCGATLHPLHPTKIFPTAYANDTTHGHCELNVGLHSAVWQFVGANGAILDKVTIRL